MGEEVVRRMMWTTFKDLLLKNYFPRSEKIKKQKEFMGLVLENLTVMEYTIQFERFSRFEYHMVDNSEKKNR